MNRIAIGATALALPLLTSVGPAIAQSTVYTTVNAQSGKPLRLGAYAGLNKDCSPGPLPEIRVTQNPKHGAFVMPGNQVLQGGPESRFGFSNKQSGARGSRVGTS